MINGHLSKIYWNRSICFKMFFEIGVLENLAISTGKHLCWSLFLIKLQVFRTITLLKRDSNTGIAKFLRTAFFVEHLWWLLLLEKDNSVPIHYKGLQAVATETFKVDTKTSPGIMQSTNFVISYDKSVNYGLESIRVLGPKIWECLPYDEKKKESADSFKTAIKEWKTDSCLSRLCKIYLQNKTNVGNE